MGNIQAKVEVFIKLHEMKAPIEHRVLDLVSEVGEVAKEVLKASDYGRSEPDKSEGITDELGDVMFSLAAVANHYGVDLREAANSAMAKYGDRIASKGSPQSQDE